MKKFVTLIFLLQVSLIFANLKYENLPIKEVKKEEIIENYSSILTDENITNKKIEELKSEEKKIVPDKNKEIIKKTIKKAVKTTENTVIKTSNIEEKTNIEEENVKEEEVILNKKLIYDEGNFLLIEEEKKLHIRLEKVCKETGINIFIVTNTEENYYNVEDSVYKYFANVSEKIIVFNRMDNKMQQYYVGSLKENALLKKYITENILKNIYLKSEVKNYYEELTQLINLIEENQNKIMEFLELKFESNNNEFYKDIYNIIIISLILIVLFFLIMLIQKVLKSNRKDG